MVIVAFILLILIGICGILALIFCVIDGDVGGEFVYSLTFSIMFTALTIACGIVGFSSYERQTQIMSMSEDNFSIGLGNTQGQKYYYYVYNINNIGKVSVNRTEIISDDAIEPCLFEIKNSNQFMSEYILYVPTDFKIILMNIT